MRVSILLILVLGSVACGSNSASALLVTPAAPSVLPSISQAPTEEPWDLEADIGAITVLSWTARTPWAEVQQEITSDQIGGVLLFAANFGGTAGGLKVLDDRLLALSSAICSAHPILTMLDEEGGSVVNVKAPFAPPWPVNMASGGPAHVADIERANGAGLRAAGLGLDLAPVADVRTNPLDEVIGGRSFGSNPSIVAPLVAAAVQGLHEGGVGATLKHFPGLGGAAGDPHVAVPEDAETEAHWEAVQLPSFRAGIAAGADAVMVTAVYAPALGAGDTPAIFSAPVVHRIRTQLGFSGVIMTDSLSMGGIGAKWPLPAAAVMAVSAGNDMILLSNGDPAYEARAIAAVKAAVLSGKISWAQVHASAQRVNALRDRWGRHPMKCAAPKAQ
jgi:beta-N-acetylhexosaminidase